MYGRIPAGWLHALLLLWSVATASAQAIEAGDGAISIDPKIVIGTDFVNGSGTASRAGSPAPGADSVNGAGAASRDESLAGTDSVNGAGTATRAGSLASIGPNTVAGSVKGTGTASRAVPLAGGTVLIHSSETASHAGSRHGVDSAGTAYRSGSPAPGTVSANGGTASDAGALPGTRFPNRVARHVVLPLTTLESDWGQTPDLDRGQTPDLHRGQTPIATLNESDFTGGDLAAVRKEETIIVALKLASQVYSQAGPSVKKALAELRSSWETTDGKTTLVTYLKTLRGTKSIPQQCLVDKTDDELKTMAVEMIAQLKERSHTFLKTKESSRSLEAALGMRPVPDISWMAFHLQVDEVLKNDPYWAFFQKIIAIRPSAKTKGQGSFFVYAVIADRNSKRIKGARSDNIQMGTTDLVVDIMCAFEALLYVFTHKPSDCEDDAKKLCRRPDNSPGNRLDH